MPNGTLHLGNSIVFGTNAEVLSVLKKSSLWNSQIPGGDWNRIAQILDTRTPAEERAPAAVVLLREIQNLDAVARWIPRFDRLPEAEFHQEFYPGYRDHSIHTLHAWLLGLYLYETVSALREPLTRMLSARTGSELDREKLFCRWWTFAALWHDCGYPLESEGMTDDASIRSKRLGTVATALSSDGQRSGLKSAGYNPSDAQLREIHRAGRYAPVVIDTIDQMIGEWDEERTIDALWGRLGLPMAGVTACKVLDDLTMQATSMRRPFHDHGLFGALMLSRCAREGRAFVDELLTSLDNSSFRSLRGQLPIGFMNGLQDAWTAFYEADELIKAAVEAISFHNYDFRSLDPVVTRRALGSTERPKAELQNEPHAVFLALVDTLQDWDRHHFFPQSPEESRYRPAVRSDRMLLQGVNSTIQVTIDGTSDAAKKVRNLFQGWITGVDGLFRDGAKFTHADEILATQGPTLAVLDTSSMRLKRTIAAIDQAAEMARQELLRNHDRAVVDAASYIEPALQRAEREQLQASDQKELKNYLQTSSLRLISEQVSTHIRPGTHLPIGRIVDKIGEGGFGKVWRVAQDNRSGVSMLAIKIFHGHDLGDTIKRSYFERGYEAMRALYYVPGVVKVEKLLVVPYGLSMEYVPGSNLEDMVHSIGDTHVRLDLLRKIAEILAASHQKGIIHRDVKPANVLLDSMRDNEPVLTDYDLAYVSGKTTLAKTQFANEKFGAPEQFNEKLAPWARKPGVDVYSFGVLAYYVLTKRDPPMGTVWAEEQWGVLQSALDGHLPAVVLEKLIKLLQELTQRDPNQRLVGIDEMRQMEHVVSYLSQMINMSQTSKEEVAPEVWLREVIFKFAGRAPEPRQTDFGSPAGGTTWTFEIAHERGQPLLIARGRLNREPRHEGVNYAGYSRKSSIQVDRTLMDLGRIGQQPCARRHGELGRAGSEMRIEILIKNFTLKSAREVGDCFKAVARAVE